MASIRKRLALRTARFDFTYTFYDRHYGKTRYSVDQVIRKMGNSRKSGSVRVALARMHEYLYQASKDHPGYIEQVESATGKVMIGSFYNGVFHPGI